MDKLKKILSVVLTLIFTLSFFVLPTYAKESIDMNGFVAEDQIVETVTGIYDSCDLQAKASSGLILSKSLKLSKTSTGLLISAQTTGSTEVTKCGFTYIKLQRLINGTWTDYTTYCYKDQYKDASSMTFSKAITPAKGYTYRVVCEHYAEKKRLLILKNKETSYNVTASLSY